jgi:hypothetical protein
LVAQAQALIHIASQAELLSFWWPRGVPDVGPTFPELAVKAGLAHAEIASGRHDDRLPPVLAILWDVGSMSFIPGVGAIQEGIDLIAGGLEAVEQLGTTSELPDKPTQPPTS